MDVLTPPPISAAEALSLIDTMIRIQKLWHGRFGTTAETVAVNRRWLLQIRPHLVEAAERDSKGDPT